MQQLYRYREQLAKERIERETERSANEVEAREILNEYVDLQTELDTVKKSNSANQTWNTRYRNTIESLKKEIEEKEVIRKKMIKELVLLQDYNINQGKIIDESKIVVEFLVTKAKKSEMEAAKATAKKYYRS